MQRVITKNRMIGAILILLAIFVFITCSQYPEPKISGDVGSGVFPMISAGVSALCGLLLFLPQNQKDNKKGSLTKEQWCKVFTLFGLYVVYYGLLYVAGYAIGTFISVLLLFIVISKEKHIPIWRGIVYAIAVTAAFYVLFHLIFHIRLPKGIIF